MKIVIAIPTIKPGGAEKQAALLAASLNKDNEVHFFSFNGMKNHSERVLTILKSAKVEIHYLEGSKWQKCKSFYKFLKENQVDVAFNYITYCDVVGAIVEKMAGVKLVYNGIRNSRLAILKLIAEWFAHNFVADYTIYNCFSGANYFEGKGFKRSKTIVIPNCFPNISEPINRDNSGLKTIITIGRFEPQKDYLTAIKAIAEVKKRRSDFRFTIIGHGQLEQRIRFWVKEYGIQDITTIFIAPNNVQDILKAADIYISTSLFEGTSNSIMEAMNWSIPIVATNVGDNDRLIADGQSGYLAAVGDVRYLADRLDLLLKNDAQRNIMGKYANKQLHNYSVEQFELNYKKILKGGN